MILASQNVQIAEEKDFVREKISGIFFVNTSQTKGAVKKSSKKQKAHSKEWVFCFLKEERKKIYHKRRTIGTR